MSKSTRETQLLRDGSPCDTNFYEDGPMMVIEAKMIGISLCPYKEKCDQNLNPTHGWQCIMRAGVDVAKYVANQGNTVENEVEGDFREFFMEGNPPKKGYVWSSDREKFVFISDRNEALAKIKEFATLALFGTRTPKDQKASASRRKEGTLCQDPVSLDGVSIDAGETAMRASANVRRDGGVPVHACGLRSNGDCPCGICTMNNCAACFASMY